MFAISCEIDGRIPMNLYLFLEKARSTPHLLYVHKKCRVCGITHTFQVNGKSLASSPAPGVRRSGNTWITQSIVPKRPSKLYPKGPVHCTQKAHLLYPNGFVPKRPKPVCCCRYCRYVVLPTAYLDPYYQIAKKKNGPIGIRTYTMRNFC